MKNSIIRFQNITKNFESIKALNKISIEIPENSIFGILGPNGSGKSTLMRILAGLIKSWDGEIEIMGKKYDFLDNSYINQFGFLIEAPSFYEYLSAKENLKILSRLTNENAEKIDSVLETVKLTDRAKDKVKTFSYGMKQRLGLAQCLLHDPQILIIDEPNNALDPSGIRQMSKILEDLHKKNKTICISTHILSEVDTICTHAAIFKKGTLISTVELNKEYQSLQTFIISSDNLSKYKNKFYNTDFLTTKRLNHESLIIQLSKSDDLLKLKKIISSIDDPLSMSKQSNLIEFFND